MSTGYTYKIEEEENYEFKEFVMDCARAFGACIELRDESGEGENIPEKFEADTKYNEDAIAELNFELNVLKLMTREERVAEVERVNKRTLESLEVGNEKSYEVHCRYVQMLDKVNKWEPPTPNHVGMKEFMIEQIQSSMKNSGPDNYYERELERFVPSTGDNWYDDKVRCIQDSIAYHKSRICKVEETAKNRTEWVTQLRDSIKEL